MDNYKLSGVPERQYNCRSAGSIARPEGANQFNQEASVPPARYRLLEKDFSDICFALLLSPCPLYP